MSEQKNEDNVLQMPADIDFGSAVVQPDDPTEAETEVQIDPDNPLTIMIHQAQSVERIADALEMIALYFERKGLKEGHIKKDDLDGDDKTN